MKQRIAIDKAKPNVGAWDFSHLLDAPAGKHGFVEAKGGHFYFADGTRARFIGFNIAARSNMPDHETAEKIAARFATMGVNIVRMHAADNVPSNKPRSWTSPEEAPFIDYQSGSSRNLNPVGLDRFDYLFAKLKGKGIYIHLDTLVARSFIPGDGLDYPGAVPPTAKCYPTMNEKLIELQKEYMEKLLTHVNPYTGLAYAEDPAIVTVQISNEESFIKGTDDTDSIPEMEGYRNERQARFNRFLLKKYGTREGLKLAWTFEGVCALGEEEDPSENTVRIVKGSFQQPANEPMGAWDGKVSPARYADYMEFGIRMNRNYYRQMIDFLHGLGVRVPIVTSNLLGGAADIYGHKDGDLMENNCYFNHPIPPFTDGTYMCVGPTEYVTVNPLTMQRGIGALATTLTSFGAVAAVEGKPFMLSEWNEYGLHPFHSTGIVETVAYACLNDWDGLIVYNHHTSEHADDQPADEILNVFDCYNDPSMVCQWGFIATMFLKGLVKPAKNRFDVVYTQNDLKTLPTFHSMPTTFLPYIGRMRNVFLEDGERYDGNAAVAFTAGFLDGGDLSEASHGVYYRWSPYRDAMRKDLQPEWMEELKKGTSEIAGGVHASENTLVFDDIAAVSQGGDYRELLKNIDKVMKLWGILPEGTGYVDGKMVSDTGELQLDPDHAKFTIRTPECSFFSGAPEERTVLSDKVSLKVLNDRISVSMIAENGRSLEESHTFLLTAIGRTGMDGTTTMQGPSYMGIPITILTFGGKLYAETLEGEIFVDAPEAALEILDPYGNVIITVSGVPSGNGVKIPLDGSIPGIQYRLVI